MRDVQDQDFSILSVGCACFECENKSCENAQNLGEEPARPYALSLLRAEKTSLGMLGVCLLVFQISLSTVAVAAGPASENPLAALLATCLYPAIPNQDGDDGTSSPCALTPCAHAFQNNRKKQLSD